MKKLILLGLTVILFASCQQTEQRYFDESDEIETVKQLFKLSVDGKFDEVRAFYNDTAKIFINSTKGISPDESTAEDKKSREGFSMFTLKDSIYAEMVITKSGNTWVNTWPTWVGKVKGNDEEITLPFQASFQFKDGKIVREESFYNALPIYLAMEKAKADKAEAEMESSEE